MVARFRVLATASVLILLMGSISVETHAQSPDDAAMAKRFVGMWRLGSRTFRFADGTIRKVPLVAYIIYTDTGHMCYVGMKPNRLKWKSDTAPTPDELVSAMRTTQDFGAYCSTVEVHSKEGFVLHHVEIDKVPNMVSKTRKRWFTFDGSNRVSLRVDPSENTPPVVEDVLTWERVQ